MSKLLPEASAFALSRIYAQGWNAGKKLIAGDGGEVTEPDLTARNPYSTPEERARWMKGVTDAFASRAGPSTTPVGWRPARLRAKAGAS
jgi:ribosome modulation factor